MSRLGALNCIEMLQPAQKCTTHSLYCVSEDILPGKPGVESVGDQVGGRQLLLSHCGCLDIFHIIALFFC